MRLGQSLGQLHLVDVEDRGAHQPGKLGDVEAERLGLGLPALAQLGLRDVLALGQTGLECRRLRSLGRGGAVALDGSDDLLATVRKGLAETTRHAGHIGVALGDLLEQQPELAGQLIAKDRLVDEAGGAGMAIEVTPIEGGPAPVGPLGQIGEQDVGVQRRVAGSAGAMAEGGADEALAITDSQSPVATAHMAGVTLEVLQGGVDGAVMAGDDHLRCGLVAQAPDHRYRLRCRQRQVETGPGRPGGAQRIVGAGVTAG